MNRQQRLRIVLKYVVLALVAVVFLFPFAWMLATSLKTNSEALTNPTSLLPAAPQWGNYPAVIGALNFWREALNSLIMTLGVTFGQIILAALAGYAFARLKFFGRDVLFLLILATLIIPFQILFVPLYLMLAGWGDWLNTFKALIIPSLASPFAIFVFRQFFITVPKELDEAAKIDGAGYYRIFWTVMLPLAGPAVATVFILTFLAQWNDLLKPLVFNSSPDMYTLQQGLAVTLNRGANLVPNVATLMAGVVLASIVPVVMFLIGQKWFVRSVASTGLKG
jgi:multiple sugar transport system permease protein